PRADLPGSGHRDEIVVMDFNTHATARALHSPTSPAVPPPSSRVELHIRHPAGFERHASDAIDVSAQWRGHVTAVTPAS
ncbi:MAG: hypothetical protein ACRDT0_19110, partial [Pseudonocardiaceae bacterium]